jgi:hypothetical protein
MTYEKQFIHIEQAQLDALIEAIRESKCDCKHRTPTY